jgi:hypothetical protein
MKLPVIATDVRGTSAKQFQKIINKFLKKIVSMTLFSFFL